MSKKSGKRQAVAKQLRADKSKFTRCILLAHKKKPRLFRPRRLTFDF
jgi:hypothetical protein